MAQENTQKWTEKQVKLIRFVGRGKRDKLGNKYTYDQFANIIGVHRRTLYDWMDLPGFTQAVFDFALKENMHYLPELLKAQTAAGLNKKKGGDPNAAKLLLRQYQLLQPEHIDHTTNGKELPVPIVQITNTD